MALATLGLLARLFLLQVSAPRLLRGALAGQPCAHRADPGGARPDPRSLRRGDGRQPAGLPARAGARGSAGRRRRRSRAWCRSASSAPEDVDEIERTIDSSRSFDSVPIRLRMSDEDVGALCRAALRVPGSRHQDPPDALVPERQSRRACARLRRRDQRTGPEAHRPRHLRRHFAHRQARCRERLRAAAARHQWLPRGAGERPGPLGGAPGPLRAEPAHQGARSAGEIWCCRST